ncbi:MAG: tetratricopeptide repeat protein [Calditrichaeota bacterium]|nr:tetratricopeptide repeat protein [Calditrichota bacterium]
MSELIFETINQKFESAAIFSFDWLPTREQYVSGNIEPIDVVREIAALMKNNSAPFVIIFGASGSGKTRAIYEFAHTQKKNSCYFANWNDDAIDAVELSESFQRLPSAKKFIILDDVHLNPRKAVQFCLRVVSAKVKFILLTRYLQDLTDVLKEFRVESYRTFELNSLENIGELLTVKNADYLNVEIKQRLLQIANKNPQILALAHEFIQFKIKENNAFDVLKFLSKISDSADLLQAIYRDIYEQFGAPGIEFIARSVMLQGIHRSHPFCKKTFRSYVKLRNLRYFYVTNDIIHFRPELLGEFIAQNFYFPMGEINPAFHELVASSEPNELMTILSLLLLFYKKFRANTFKTAAALILASAGIKSISNTETAKLCIRFYHGFRDAQLIKNTVPNLLELKLHASEPELFNQVAIFYAEIGAHESAARNWEKLLELAREKELPGWVTVAYSNLGLVYQKLQDWDNSLECYRLAHERFQSTGAIAASIQSLINMAQVFQQKGDAEKAIDHFKNAVRESERTKNHQRTANLYLTLANFYKKQNQQNEAIIHLQSARSFFNKANDPQGSARVCGHLGMIFKARRDLEAANEYFKKAIEEAQKANDIKTAAQSYNNLALVYQQQRETEAAVEAYQQAAEKFRQIDDLQSLFLTQINLAQILEAGNKGEEALAYYKKALGIQEQLGDQKLLADNYFHIAELHLQLKDWQQAIIAYEKGLEYPEPENDRFAAKIYANMAFAYQQINLQGRAIQFYEEALTKMTESDDLELIAKTKSQLAMSLFANQNFGAAISLLMEVLFYYLHQQREQNVREIIAAFDQIQNSMKKSEFNELSDGEMNRVLKTGIVWHERTILPTADTKKIVEQFKQRREKRGEK